MKRDLALYWLRDDLRLADNPALTAAAKHGALICVHVLETNPSFRPFGGAARWWLAQSLRKLSADLAALGQQLVLLEGDSEKLLPRLADAMGATAITWNRRYGAAETACDARLKSLFKAKGIDASSFNAKLLNEPWEVTTQTGTPVKVFTPYWRAARANGEPLLALPVPRQLPAMPASGWQDGLQLHSIDSLALEPTRPDWAGGLRAEWTPGEAGAQARLATFLDAALAGYGDNRNRPDMPATSMLSPHLKLGEISPRQIWHAAQQAQLAHADSVPAADLAKFLAEIGWREFAYHLLHYNPQLHEKNYNPKFDAFPWANNPAALYAWQRGQTGYPMVDAGMRQLWQTGWMHNRVRMIVGSFLVKHLLLDWRHGETWFWDTLVDADPANNAASWQWIAGSGADAAPYFRIFNPMGQGIKFDPDGDYVRKYVPELAALPREFIHEPWTAPPGLLLGHGVVLGKTYPHPIVDHGFARDRALAALSTTKTEMA